MKMNRLALLLSSLLAAATIDVAWADRGRGGRHFQPRPNVAKPHVAPGHRFHPRPQQFHHRHRARVGVFIAAPLAWHFPPPYYAPVIAVPASPPVYIEQGAASEPAYWYHCEDPEGYYPYVKECPGGWQRVVPTPPE
jgi:hypothetical protein